MPKVSIIIPARNEPYLCQTVEGLYENSLDSVEVVVILDGHTDFAVPSKRPGLTILSNPDPLGIRKCINQAVEASTGEHILKTDAHCIFGAGYDWELSQTCDDDWVMVARRYTLDIATWARMPRIVDYYYLSCPWTHPRPLMMQSCPWLSKTEELEWMNPIDDLMCFQGSMWFMSRKHWDWLGGLTTDLTYAEHHEISMKTWLGGRRVVTNKNVWYAHPRKPVSGYHMSMRQVYKDHDISARYWTMNQWEGRVHDFDWLIDKFWPLPTKNNRHRIEKYYWPEDWRTFYG